MDPSTQQYGSTITSNGWSDAGMRPILYMLQVCTDGVKISDAIDTSGDNKVCL